MHQDLLQFQTCQTFSMSKTKSQDHDTLKSPWLMPQGTLTKNWPFLKKYFWTLSFFGQKWYEQPQTRSQSFQNKSLHKKRCFNLEGHLWHASLPGVYKSWKKQKKTREWKIDCHVMHLKIRLSLNENQENQKCVENNEKLYKHKSFFSCKESLFSLGNYVWNEKWPSFIILSLM